MTFAEPAARDALSRMLARLRRQRECLDFAACEIAALPGPVLEVGLGKGRTYDRLRHLLPERDLYAFDRDVHCPEMLRPPPSRLLIGDFRDTLRRAGVLLGRRVALVHADFGTADCARDEALARDLGPLLHQLVRPGGLALADRELRVRGWRALELPGEAGDWQYFGYRVA